jgi:hypothetical protein
MFTGDTKVQDILPDINVTDNDILFQYDVYNAFRDLSWGIQTKTNNGNCRYFTKTFRPGVYFLRPGVGNGTELQFSGDSGHKPPNLQLCALHLAVCAVASACGAADVFDKLFEYDPDIIGPVSGPYTLPADASSDRFVISYFERRLFEERLYISPPQIFYNHVITPDSSYTPVVSESMFSHLV